MKTILALFLTLNFIACNAGPENTEENYIEVEQSEISVQGSDIEFGITSVDGKQLITVGVETLDAPSNFTKAIVSNGKLVDIEYVGLQEPHNDNGRQIESNFSNMGGFLYNSKSPVANRDRTVVLTTEMFLSERHQLVLSPPTKQGLSAQLKSEIEKDKERTIKAFTCLAVTDGDRSIYLVEFEVVNESALATLVYVTPESKIYFDYPATFDEGSTWRVDDGGEFGMDYYDILAAFDHPEGMELITEWIGAEGYVMSFLKEVNGSFVSLKDGSRYAAPE